MRDPNELCRTCGIEQESSVDPLVSIFIENSEDQSLNPFLLKLFVLLQIDIRENDGLPQKMCTACYGTFDTFSEFLQKCKQTQRILTRTKPIGHKTDEGSSVQINFEEISLKTDLENETVKAETSIDCDHFDVDYAVPIEFCAVELLRSDKKTQNESFTELIDKSTNVSVDAEAVEPLLEISTKRKYRKYRNVKENKKRKCKFCTISFSLRSVARHERNCKLRTHEFCPYCSVEISKGDELKQHIAEKHPDGKLACSVCWQSFENRNQRNTHLHKYHNEGKYFCKICNNYDYKSSYYLNKHIRNFHGEIINRPCPICEKICSTQIRYNYHVKTHNPADKRYQCEICNERFMQSNHLAQHRMKHTKERPFLCSVCGKTSKQITNHRQHLFAAHGIIDEIKKPGPHILKFGKRDSKTNKFVCESCDKHFATTTTLRFHIQNVHETGPRFRCNVADCKMEFMTKKCLVKHNKDQHDIIEKDYLICSLCSKQFRNITGLNMHMRFHSDKDRPHKCHICNYTFKRREHVSSHIRRLHTAEKKFACSQCDRMFIENYELNDHMKMHSGSKPHKCSICSKDFRYASALNVHIRQHTGERPHFCPICQKSFASSYALSVHFKTHTIAERQNIEIQILEGINSNEK